MPKIYYIKIYHYVMHVAQKILKEIQREFQKINFVWHIFDPPGKPMMP